MRRYQLARRALDRLSQPSSAAGLAALLALAIPELAEYAPVIAKMTSSPINGTVFETTKFRLTPTSKQQQSDQAP